VMPTPPYGQPHPHAVGFYAPGTAPPPPGPPPLGPPPFGAFPLSMAFPRPPPVVRPPPVTIPTFATLPPNTRPPPTVPQLAPMQPTQDTEMEEVSPRSTDSSSLQSARPPAINTTTYGGASSYGDSTPQASATPHVGYAVGTPMPSATGTPNFHQYSSSLGMARVSNPAPKPAPKPASKPLINVVSDPNLTSTAPPAVTTEEGGSERSKASSSPSPHHRVTHRSARPTPVNRSQSAPSASDVGAAKSTSIAQIMDVIGGRRGLSSSAGSFATTPLMESHRSKDNTDAKIGTPSHQGMFSSASTKTPFSSQSGAGADASIDSAAGSGECSTDAPPSARRPRLAWGQGLRRRTSESNVQGTEDSKKSDGGELDNISELPNLTFGRAQSEIVTPTHVRAEAQASSFSRQEEAENRDEPEVVTHNGDEDEDEGGGSKLDSDAGNSDNDDMSNDEQGNSSRDNIIFSVFVMN
jgi:hypothetical protein